uniref:NADH-ubiquinone oxidoreductase chain 6 n=1 Tax=Betatropis formosana TaxID=130531 RepID=A0A451GIS4_9HEMI|nr:NADH dehydrogenase subunit 6 [Betatropis formosana]
MKMVSMIMMLNSMITPQMKHPISMGFMLMTQTTLMCIYTSTIMSTSWFGFILFITMIGGMMIMFMYMSSIDSNNKFSILNKTTTTTLMTIFMIMSTMNLLDLTMEETTKLMENKFMMTNNEEMKSTSKFFMNLKYNCTIMIMMILLLTMISVTNISSTFEGPLKKLYV